MRVLLATQDETLAHRNLDAFRDGQADILVTCAMAHVGYDCPPIAVVVALTTIRQEAWLRQLIARGLRVMEGLDPDAQCCLSRLLPVSAHGFTVLRAQAARR